MAAAVPQRPAVARIIIRSTEDTEGTEKIFIHGRHGRHGNKEELISEDSFRAFCVFRGQTHF